eukprot:8310427-Heterocapsa_arctica.AAC.1
MSSSSSSSSSSSTILVVEVVAAGVGVDKAVRVDGAAARERVRQHGQALEAEAGVAVPAAHLVALGVLRALLLE